MREVVEEGKGLKDGEIFVLGKYKNLEGLQKKIYPHPY